MDRNFNYQLRKNLKEKLSNKQKTLFVGWISFSHPSITEIFSNIDFDFNVIDMEHSTISISEAQRIIAASQSFGVPCIPRIVSHSVEQIKPLLDSGPDGMMFPTVSSVKEVDYVILGIDNPSQLKKILFSYTHSKSKFKKFKFSSDTKIIDPRSWKKK